MTVLSAWVGVRARRFFSLLALPALAVHGAAAGPIQPETVETLPIAPITQVHGNTPWPEASLSPGGQMLGLSDGRQVWLYRRDNRRRVAVTPPQAVRSAPFDPAALNALEGLAWSGDAVLYAWARMLGGSQQAFAADRDGALGPVLATPERWPHDDALPAESYPIPDPDNAYEIRANAHHVVWRRNRGHGSMDLMAARADDPPRVLASGGWELEDAVFDRPGSRVIFPTDSGLVVHALDTDTARTVAGTSAGDVPRAYDPASRWLALLRPEGGCATDSPDAKAGGWRICLLRLPPDAAD
ncbi:MAG TPA: hypothetical protein PKA16_04875 [Ottowia sp.]|uniref:hypothetical protein n=1 Tax=Ottowia sp. TaxID=1898956 RepID=UPI002B92610B|nr:hypothetical protein [Ottowia sp.]HMN20707.1 hypothetical protein [Ottowia sp.]